MTPTQVVNAAWEELAAQQGGDQVAIIGKYLELVAMDTKNMPDGRFDRLSLGEGSFLTFQVEPARKHFATLLDGDDLITRHAWRRMMQIQFRALGDLDEARAMVDQFYAKFPPSESNYRGRDQQIANFVNNHIEAGNPEDAVGLIVDELRALPTDSPYTSYALLPRYAEVIGASSRRDEVRKLAKAKLASLEELKRRWARETVPASEDPILRGDMPSWYWRTQKVRPHESLRTARKRQLDELIETLGGWLSDQR